jgi:hypothetical protein
MVRRDGFDRDGVRVFGVCLAPGSGSAGAGVGADFQHQGRHHFQVGIQRLPVQQPRQPGRQAFFALLVGKARVGGAQAAGRSPGHKSARSPLSMITNEPSCTSCGGTVRRTRRFSFRLPPTDVTYPMLSSGVSMGSRIIYSWQPHGSHRPAPSTVIRAGNHRAAG